MRSLEGAGRPRKVLLLLAGDWPVGSFRLAGQGIGLRSDWSILDALIDTANVLGYTVYPVDQQRRPSPDALAEPAGRSPEQTGGRGLRGRGEPRSARGESVTTPRTITGSASCRKYPSRRSGRTRCGSSSGRPRPACAFAQGATSISRGEPRPTWRRRAGCSFPDETRTHGEPVLRGGDRANPNRPDRLRRKMLVPVTRTCPGGLLSGVSLRGSVPGPSGTPLRRRRPQRPASADAGHSAQPGRQGRSRRRMPSCPTTPS